MKLAQALESISPRILTVQDLLRAGMTERSIRREVALGSLIRLRKGFYIAGDYWRSLKPQHQHLAAVIAAQRASTNTLVFSHRTAATLLELPVWSGWLNRLFPTKPGRAESTMSRDPRVVHLTSGLNRRASSSKFMVRHRQALTEQDLTSTLGFAHTSPERTAFDLARSEPFAIALACVDELLRNTIRSERRINERAWKAWKNRLLSRARLTPRSLGMPAVRALAELAHPGSDSVAESISRFRCLQLGVEVEVQARVRSETGGFLYLDFLFRKYGVFGECDGKAKYTDPALRGDRTADEVLYLEKRRHDWIVGSTRMQGIRWGAEDVVTAQHFSRRLRSFGIPVPGVPIRSYGPEIAAFLSRLP